MRSKQRGNTGLFKIIKKVILVLLFPYERRLNAQSQVQASFLGLEALPA